MTESQSSSKNARAGEESTARPEPQVQWLLEMNEAGADGWSVVDDRVMGGISQGRWSVEQGVAVFAGRMTTENNGGFSSVRSADRDWKMSDGSGIVLRVRGDGQTYKLGLRVDGGPSGMAYQAKFVAAAQWRDVRIGWDELVPRRRGREVEQAGPLDPKRVRSVGILIADGQEGPFRVELARIGLWR